MHFKDIVFDPAVPEAWRNGIIQLVHQTPRPYPKSLYWVDVTMKVALYQGGVRIASVQCEAGCCARIDSYRYGDLVATHLAGVSEGGWYIMLLMKTGQGYVERKQQTNRRSGLR